MMPLEEFGKSLIDEVRNASLSEFFQTLNGEMLSQRALAIHTKSERFTPEDLSMMKDLLRDYCDLMLHNTCMFLEGNPNVRLSIIDENREWIDIEDVSDGLAGELYSDEGWLHKYGV
ncbi:hypothetical protein Pla110_17870 [Polystyrenella longa]|uniref:Uncharacterized protein n=1 Tax=Polystyrenella longa TaxID=2528007 RepID=A0A518CLF8_9PLAN|nr:hypothetical protein [Polystyrenella longa]QDU80065.1 hypothetical protein Pla110_17870 [Polystyrenella longa]